MRGDDDKLWVRQPHKVVQRLAPVIEPLVKAEGFVLVDVRYNPAGSPLLQVFADRPSEGPFSDPALPQELGQGITIDELADLSRLLSDALDVEDPISAAYRLEVSSPGLQRDLCWRSDFVRALDLTVDIRCSVAVEGRKKFKGILCAVEAEALRIQLEDQQEFVIPVERIRRAQLDFGPLASGRAAKGAGRGK